MDEIMKNAIAEINSKTTAEVRLRRQFIIDVLDDFQAGKIKSDKAVLALENIALETIDRILEVAKMKVPNHPASSATPKPVATNPVASLDEFSID